MKLTEEQARTKWCPFAHASAVHPHVEGAVLSGNRIGSNWQNAPPDVKQNLTCIASDCMAWRKAKYRDLPGTVGLGYCGLAGKP